MSDPNPLVRYVYLTYVEDILAKMRDSSTCLETKDKDVHSWLYALSPEDRKLLSSLYAESPVDLPGRAFRNPHINYYHCGPFFDFADESPIYTPSKLYMFMYLDGDVIWDGIYGDCSREDVQGCTICIRGKDKGTANSLLATCRRISEAQPITELYAESLDCYDSVHTEVFIMSKEALSLKLYWCTMYPELMEHLLEQLEDCTKIETIALDETRFHGIESFQSLHTMTSLTRLDLYNTNMCPDLCACVCKQLQHLVHLQFLRFVGNWLKDQGCHLVESIKAWGPGARLTELYLGACKMPASVCGPLLAVLSTCYRLSRMQLWGNDLDGCWSHFAPPKPDVHAQESLSNYHPVGEDDLKHVGQLISEKKLPKLCVLNLNVMALCEEREDALDQIVDTCLKHHHQRDLRLWLQQRTLALRDQFGRRLSARCRGTNVNLWL